MKTLRISAWVLISLALALVGADIVSSLEMGRPVIRTTREIMNLAPGVAIDPLGTEGFLGMVNLAIDLPLWALFGVAGLVLALLLKPVD
ncbi:MAG: hypothetical protein V2I43_13465 [Parvularcula sp.]|jgi:hypothetical protein|nr:hypothetical protein [Parvularcula sp.]